MANATMLKFGYPDTLIKEFDHWMVLLRPAQVTLGSLVVAAKGEATAYSDLPDPAFTEQADVVRAVEAALGAFCRYERINYLMLMMVDPHVHFHVIPRFSEPRLWENTRFEDSGWPGPPTLKLVVDLDESQINSMREQVKQYF